MARYCLDEAMSVWDTVWTMAYGVGGIAWNQVHQALASGTHGLWVRQLFCFSPVAISVKISFTRAASPPIETCSSPKRVPKFASVSSLS